MHNPIIVCSPRTGNASVYLIGLLAAGWDAPDLPANIEKFYQKGCSIFIGLYLSVFTIFTDYKECNGIGLLEKCVGYVGGSMRNNTGISGK